MRLCTSLFELFGVVSLQGKGEKSNILPSQTHYNFNQLINHLGKEFSLKREHAQNCSAMYNSLCPPALFFLWLLEICRTESFLRSLVNMSLVHLTSHTNRFLVFYLSLLSAYELMWQSCLTFSYICLISYVYFPASN